MTTLGFIGLGIMGKPMAEHLLAAGHTVYLNTKGSVPDTLVQAGGKACASAQEVAEKADIIFLMLPDTPDVELVLFGAKGVAESPHVGGIPCFSNAVVDAFAHLGVTHMDMPHTAYRVWQQCKALGIQKRV